MERPFSHALLFVPDLDTLLFTGSKSKGNAADFSAIRAKVESSQLGPYAPPKITPLLFCILYNARISRKTHMKETQVT